MKLILICLFVAFNLKYSTTFDQFVHVNKNCSYYNIPNNTFSLNQFKGEWYEIAKYGDDVDKCVRDYFNSNNLRANVTHFSASRKNTTIIIEQAGFSSSELKVNAGRNAFPAKVLGTDYHNYGVIWSCSNLENVSSSIQMLVVLSKDSSKNVNQLDIVKHLLNTTKLSEDGLTLSEIDHSPKICNKYFIYGNSSYNSTYSNSSHVFPGRGSGHMNSISSTVLVSSIITVVLIKISTFS